jgi:hypothetical protein
LIKHGPKEYDSKVAYYLDMIGFGIYFLRALVIKGALGLRDKTQAHA